MLHLIKSWLQVFPLTSRDTGTAGVNKLLSSDAAIYLGHPNALPQLSHYLIAPRFQSRSPNIQANTLSITLSCLREGAFPAD